MTPSGIVYTLQSATARAVVPQSDIEHGVFSLQFKDVREEDAGIYRGVAQYGDSKQVCNVMLRIIKVTQSLPGLLPENGAVNLTCAVIGPHKSMYSYHWFRGGVPISASNRISKAGPTLYVRKLTQDDHGEWTCEVDGVRASLTLRVLSMSGPPHLSLYAAVGSQVELPCNVSEVPAEESLSVHWSKATGSVRGDNQVLTLSHVTPEDAATYRCDITYRSQLMTRHITLKVIQVFPSGPTFAKEGSSLTLTCNVTGAADGERYEWRGPPNSTERHNRRKGAVLTLPAIHREDSGTWVCSVHGKNGILGEAEHWLYVHAALTGELGSFSSWQTYIVLLLCLLMIVGLVLIMGISIQNRRRRLSHLAALANLNSLPIPHTKKVSVNE
ncbi:PREDICTED: lymphocyte activation gene 3 protein-like [Nanorana parkeri]|uniref:lymphocyte activation gene 3 protein-like n=1 Tax=Nanorana parkeri TaxID=125878 RepID=UPI0008548C10|nr:PREDICTED: lymphocyte activation gene 3 protein-like [Nanorana parkeri]